MGAFARPKSQKMLQKTAPRQKLWAYQGVNLAVDEKTVLTFTLDAALLAHSNADGDRVVHPGDYEVAFSDGNMEVKANVRVTGDATLVERSVFRSSSADTVLV